MKTINENQKVTLTLGQLKKLVRESLEDLEQEMNEKNLAVTCIAEDPMAYKKMNHYVSTIVKMNEQDFELEFNVERDPENLTITISGETAYRMEELEYSIRKYLQAHPDARWERKIEKL